MERITMELRDMEQGYRAVAFNAPLSYFAARLKLGKNGTITQVLAEMTVKDCRHIDGTVYFAKGRVDDATLCRYIRYYNAEKDNGKWKRTGEKTSKKSLL